MINDKFTSYALNIGNWILSYASATNVDDNKRASKNSIRETRVHEITQTAMNFRSIMITTRNVVLAAKHKEKKERSCNIIIHGREENKELSDDLSNMMQQICGSFTPKLISRIGRSEGNNKKPIKFVLHNNKTRKIHEITYETEKVTPNTRE